MVASQTLEVESFANEALKNSGALYEPSVLTPQLSRTLEEPNCKEPSFKAEGGSRDDSGGAACQGSSPHLRHGWDEAFGGWALDGRG